MHFSAKTSNPAKAETGCMVVPVFSDPGEARPAQLLPAAVKLDDASEGLINQLMDRGDFDAGLGKVLMVPFAPGIGAERLLLVGLGARAECNEGAFIKALEAGFDSLLTLPLDDATIAFIDAPIKDRDAQWKARKICEVCLQASYRFDQFKSLPSPAPPSLSYLVLQVTSKDDTRAVEHGIAIGQAIGSGTALARTLANLPGNLCTPVYLADQARELAAASQGALTLEVFDEDGLADLGATALLAVGQGSRQPSRLIVMHYAGAEDPDQAPHVLVGKGITFDSGGISLKPGEAMDEMKFDMGGAASVMGAAKAVLELGPRLNLVFIVAAAENMPDGDALRPGDILTTLKGLSVEVLNTDAEGRLVLCDALAYAERLAPASVIDIATLTGACITGLGHHASGLLSNQEALAQSLLEAGVTAWDRAWQLPLWDEYQQQLDSTVADLANIGGRPAGTITAACFLSRFADSYPWAHLDIAGTAWHSGKQKGATGRPVGLLTQYLLDRDAEHKAATEQP